MAKKGRRTYIQIVERTKPRHIRFFRAMPETAEEPTLAQILQRLRFGETAKLATGRKMSGELPPAAELVKSILKDVPTGYRRKKVKKWQQVLIEFIKETVPEKEEQERLMMEVLMR